MATVQTLKDKNNETFYPVTKTEAVYNADGSETLDTTIDNFSNVVQNLSDTKATISTSASDANKMMKADGTKALVGSDNIDFTTLGRTTLQYYSTSTAVIETSTYSPITEGTITTHGGGLLVTGFVYGTLTSGVAYLSVKIDDTTYQIGQINSQTANIPMNGIRYFDNIAPGNHTISFGVTRQDGTNRSYTIAGYTLHRVQFIEC